MTGFLSGKIFVGNSASGLTEADKLQPYSKVTVTDGTNSYTSGDDTGRELTVNVPLLPSIKGDTLAANILAAVKNYRYQPYEAAGALLDPAAELGDGVTVGGIYGGIHAKTTTFSRLFRATVSAPAEEEIDNEYPYLSAQERDAVRQKKQTAQNTADIATNTSDIEANADDIAANASAITEIRADIAEFGTVYATKASVDLLSAKIGEFDKIFAGTTIATKIRATSLTAESSLYVPYGGGTRKVSVSEVTINSKVYNILTI
nr:MAG TPA: hypothetical protein [Caudoviricetes sp.]